MKIFLLIFVILNTPSTFAKNISDFQIEGISIGDSVLDYFTKKEINKKEKLFFPNSKKYYRIAFELQNSSSYEFIACPSGFTA